MGVSSTSHASSISAFVSWFENKSVSSLVICKYYLSDRLSEARTQSVAGRNKIEYYLGYREKKTVILCFPSNWLRSCTMLLALKHLDECMKGYSMNDLQLAHRPVTKADSRIRKPVTDVTEAFFSFTCGANTVQFAEARPVSPL